jgi:LDH2 family malate/lactate/ureidoglycolate dehydrogenase
MPGEIRLKADVVRDFTAALFERLNVPAEDAAKAARVLVRADQRGVMSHGIKNLPMYTEGLTKGYMNPHPQIHAVAELPVTAVLDGDGGLGMVVGTHAMEMAIAKAQASGTGMVTVRRSHHFGMASFYSLMALPHNMIGIALTNNAGIAVVPTFGAEAMFSTNPISVVVPAGEEPPFELDMSTAVVAFNKVDLAHTKGESVPLGWGLDANGETTSDAGQIVASKLLLPLGGTTITGSHKGYGLGVVVDILCGVLSGGIYGNLIARQPSDDPYRDTSSTHFFAAMRIDAFRPVDEFKASMDDMLRALKNSKKAKGHDRIYVAGEMEHEIEAERLAHGIPYPLPLIERLEGLARQFDVPLEIRD